MTRYLAPVILAAAFIFTSVAHAAPSPIEVMLLDGESGGPYHAWQVTTPILKKELEDTGLFAVTVVTAPPSGADFSSFKPDFSHYKVDRFQLRCARLARKSSHSIRGLRAKWRRPGHRPCR